ncbi:Arsenical resistance operon trans-acting repressor ArsD [Ruminococcus sp. YE71]|uniref:arsenite efflux transporter metallochaperone ArsD n=1 Tax=unclassified Ruminococcus TaxID=2608920 RepID=UPI0008872271|nr:MULTISPECIES: arsenite efflux transporter metallochaperone ArsD [unclassified Ruminococcus]SDA21814.1 Arsenical resistance operon trans-acting repressor ArsD [Ruminococcus sp. YE78]SFW36918.1 Arsenical resistance operon trans-acting repressor ArsD [Ruminococcus sp. YE71]
MKEMQIFEPALCCETGVCGASVDPELLRITTMLDRLKKNGVTVRRFNLNSTPLEFITNQTVNAFINKKGAEALPVVLVDGSIVIEGRYPSNTELLDLLELPASALLPQDFGGNNGGCCCSGSGGGCC